MSLSDENVSEISQSLLLKVSIPNSVLDESWFHETIKYVASEGYEFGYDDGRDAERYSD